MLRTLLWIAIVGFVWGGMWLTLRALRSAWHPHSANVGNALRTAERSQWHVSMGSPTRIASVIPDDPATTRQLLEHVRGTHRWAVGDAVVMAETPRGGGAEERVFYVLAPFEDDEDAVVYCRSLDSVTRSHASRGSLADRVVAAVRTRAPAARMVWVARNHVGIGLDADTVTNPASWARWLGEVVEDVVAGRSPGAPPASW